MDPDNDDSNLICAAKSTLESENVLSKSVEQNQPSTSTKYETEFSPVSIKKSGLNGRST